MNLAFIGCSVILREITSLMAGSPHVFFPVWMEQGLHNTPDRMRAELQKAVDRLEEINARRIDGHKFDAIIFGYGLCSNGTVGLRSRSVPFIIPRCDDCIALFLGSRARYLKLFNEESGTYWYNSGWLEQASDLPSPERFARERAAYLKEYEDEETADYLCEMSQSWVKNYHRAAYILSPLGDRDDYREKVKGIADAFGWRYEEYEGQMQFFEKMLAAGWDPKEFFYCPPRSVVTAAYDGSLFGYIPDEDRKGPE